MNLPVDYIGPGDLLKDRVVLVTGAGQGLGRAAALAFARHGATVVLHGRKVPKLEAVYDAIVEQGAAQPAIFPLDLAQAVDGDFDNLANAIFKEFGRLDGILHSASHFVPLSPLAIQTLDQWLELTRVNLCAPFAMTRACLPLLKKAADASVIFTSETHAADARAYWGGFAVAKSGLHTLVSVWADEFAGSPLRFNALVPGPVATPQRHQSHPGESPAALPAPESLLPAYLWLMGPDSRGVSGHVLAKR